MTTVEKRAATTSGTVLARTGLVNVIFTATILLSALQLFAVQPMVSKMLLPPYGGAAAVWTTSLLFFQTVLLIGYAYAHFAPRWLGRWHPLVHILLVLTPLAVLPIALPTWAEPGGSGTVVGWLLLVLTVMVGLPFVVLSTTGPLVQAWYSTLGLPRSHDPYFLYAASNIGSLAALIGYPFLIEPLVSIQPQSLTWTTGYGVFALLIVGCTLIVRRKSGSLLPRPNPSPSQEPQGESTSPQGSADRTGTDREERAAAATPPSADTSRHSSTPLTWRRRLRWLALAALPSSLMQGVTTYMSTDVAAVPLLWVLPLALYLSTFVIGFGVRSHGWVPGVVDIALVGSVPVLLLALRPSTVPVPVAMVLAMAMLTVTALATHGLLAKDRPAAVHLTEFFLIVSLGGALGSLFNGVIAPIAFNQVLEYPIVLVTVALLVLTVHDSSRLVRVVSKMRWAAVLRLTLIALSGVALGLFRFYDQQWALLLATMLVATAVLLLIRQSVARTVAFILVGVVLIGINVSPRSGANEHHGRTFFGSYSIKDENDRRVLAHGTTVHGFQLTGADEHSKPVSYYSETGPVGDLFRAYGPDTQRAAVVGLGTGVIAAYGEQGQRFDFYEIDPEMVRVAKNPEWFTYLRDCSCETRTIIGDGRLELEKSSKGSYDIIVLDAFNSDSIPTHMLTRQALEEFSARLTDGGVLAVHVSNRTLDLAPMVGATAEQAGLSGLVREDDNFNSESGTIVNPHASSSEWIVLANDPADLTALTQPSQPHADQWNAVPPDGPVWTDGYSSLFGVLRW